MAALGELVEVVAEFLVLACLAAMQLLPLLLVLAQIRVEVVVLLFMVLAVTGVKAREEVVFLAALVPMPRAMAVEEVVEALQTPPPEMVEMVPVA